jgi:hypothetical protein
MEVKIKSENLPTRCEICHQADLFEPARNFCRRCAAVPQRAQSSTLAGNANRATKAATITDIEMGATIGLLIGALAGFIGGYLAFDNIGLALAGTFPAAALWTIHGGIIGLFVGQSSELTYGASVSAVSRAVQAGPQIELAPADLRHARLKKMLKKFRGPLLGLLFGLLPRLILSYLGADSLFWTIHSSILLCLLCGTIIGFFTELLCRRRSDRRVSADYPAPAQE